MTLKIFIILSLFFSANITYGQELKTISAQQFLAENPSKERKEIVNFIIHQFDDKREVGVTQAKLDDLWNNLEVREAFSLSRFQIVDQKLYAESSNITHLHFMLLLRYFETFLKNHKIKDIDFIFYTTDEIIPNNGLEKHLLGIPAFMGSKNRNSEYEKNMLLLPDEFIISEEWRRLFKRIDNANQHYNWDDKINKIFWRGSTTGKSEGAYRLDNFDKLPRVSLVILSKLYPDLIDAQFTYHMRASFDQDDKKLKKILKLLFGKGFLHIAEEDHLKYKYLIAVDGNTSPWIRVPWIMLSNSVLVRQESSYMEWFYPALKPYVHYVPVNERLTNIFEQLEWMKSHDLELQNITHNAHNFVENNLKPEHIDAHMAIILNEYATIQKDEKIVPTLTPAEDVISMFDLLKALVFKGAKKFITWIEIWI